MTDPAPPSTPAGWYPEGANGLRYWNGTVWTEKRAPAGPHTAAPAKRTRNYAGDIALALAICGLVGTIVFRFPAWSLIALVGALIVGIGALTTAHGTRSRASGTIAVIIGGGLGAFGLLLYAVANR